MMVRPSERYQLEKAVVALKNGEKILNKAQGADVKQTSAALDEIMGTGAGTAKDMKNRNREAIDERKEAWKPINDLVSGAPKQPSSISWLFSRVANTFRSLTGAKPSVANALAPQVDASTQADDQKQLESNRVVEVTNGCEVGTMNEGYVATHATPEVRNRLAVTMTSRDAALTAAKLRTEEQKASNTQSNDTGLSL